MAEKSVVVRLAAQVSSYVSSMGQAKKATDDVAAAAEKAGQKQGQSAKQAATAAAATAAAMAKEAQAVQDAAKAHGMHYNSSGKLVDANNKFVSSAAAAEAGLSTYSKTVQDAAAASKAAADAAAAAGGPLKRLGATLDEVAGSAKNNRQAWDQAGGALTAFGAVAVGGLGLAAKAAMDWESAWAGVTKTVDGTPEQMADMEVGLRNLAKTLPLAHTEIAAVAEAAGQLGVAREDVIGFTKTMIDLGESTNLTADEAATQIAQISNVTGLMAREGAEGVSRFGATLVELGNNGASTEAEILSMAQRIAGAMTTVGGTEVEVLAVSNALASMGVRAELGGGVTTRVLLGMYSSIKEGGGRLEAFAKTAGVSAEAFAAAFESSPVTALSMVSQGLARVDGEGGNVVASLADMGLKGTETTQVMLALANSGTLLADGLAQGDAAWASNTALLEEASKRYATTESRIAIAWNNIKDAAITAGGVILPIIADVADTVVQLAEVWAGLPAPVQNGIVALTGVAGAASLVAGGFLLVVPRVLETVTAFKTLSKNADGGTSALGRMTGALGKTAGVAAVAFVGFEVIKGIHNSMQPATASLEEMTQALIRVKDQGGALDDVFGGIDAGGGGALLKNVHGVGDALAALDAGGASANLQSFGATVLGVDNDVAKILATLEQTDAALASAASSGNTELAAKGFKQIADSAAASGVGMDEVVSRFPEYEKQLLALASAHGYTYKEGELHAAMLGKLPPALTSAMSAAEGTGTAVEQAAAAQEAAAAASEELIEALAEIGLSAEGTIIDLQKFTDMLFSMGLATMSSREAAFGWESTLRGMGEAVQGVVNSQGELGPLLNATGTDFNMLTESGKNANEMLQGIVSDGLKVAETFSGDVTKSAADVNQQLTSTYDAGVQAAMGLGLGKDQAIALTRELMGIPPGVSVETWMSDAAEKRADTTGEAIGEIPESVYVETAMDTAAFETAGMTKQAAEDIPNQETIDSWMSDAAFQEALRTRAAALGIPEQEVIDSFMSSAARNEADQTTAQVLKIPAGASVSAFMSAYIRDMAAQSAAGLNAIDGRVVNAYANYYETTFRSIVTSDRSDAPALGPGGRGGPTLANGGRIPRFAVGGRLPTTGPGTEVTDGIYGISSKTGLPAAMLDGGEWIINSKSSDKHNGLLAAVNRDDPRLKGLPAFARGGRIDGLSANPGEENWEWQDRQLRVVQSMESTVGKIADWDIHEDGSGWIRTMDDTMVRIADGTWRITHASENATEQLGKSAEDAHWAGETARAAGGSFRGAGVSADAAAGTFTVAGQVTAQAAAAIVAATAAVNAAGAQRAEAQGGGITARPGEANAVWRGRQDQFEQAISQQFGGIKYSDIHEDGSGQMVLDDGRLIQLDNGRWSFVSQFKYGAPLVNGVRQRTLSKYATGGRLPTSGPGTDRRDGILGISSLTGEPTAYVDPGEWIVSAKQSALYDRELAAINAGTFPRLALGGRATSREYAPAMSYAGASGQAAGLAVADQRPSHATATVNLLIDGRKLHTEIVRLPIRYN